MQEEGQRSKNEEQFLFQEDLGIQSGDARGRKERFVSLFLSEKRLLAKSQKEPQRQIGVLLAQEEILYEVE